MVTIYSILMVLVSICLLLAAITDKSIYLYLTLAIVFMLAVVNIAITVIGV